MAAGKKSLLLTVIDDSSLSLHRIFIRRHLTSETLSIVWSSTNQVASRHGRGQKLAALRYRCRLLRSRRVGIRYSARTDTSGCVPKHGNGGQDLQASTCSWFLAKDRMSRRLMDMRHRLDNHSSDGQYELKTWPHILICSHLPFSSPPRCVLTAKRSRCSRLQR